MAQQGPQLQLEVGQPTRQADGSYAVAVKATALFGNARQAGVSVDFSVSGAAPRPTQVTSVTGEAFDTLTIPGPGTYWIGVSAAISGQQKDASRPVTIATPAVLVARGTHHFVTRESPLGGGWYQVTVQCLAENNAPVHGIEVQVTDPGYTYGVRYLTTRQNGTVDFTTCTAGMRQTTLDVHATDTGTRTYIHLFG